MEKNWSAKQERRFTWYAATKRSAFASLIYIVLWCLISFTGYKPLSGLLASVVLWSIFVSTPLARFMLLYKFDFCYKNLSPLLWFILFTVLAISPSLAWTYITTQSLLQTTSWEINLAIVLALIGIVSGGVNTFSPVMHQTVIFIIIMLLPPTYVIASFDTPFPKMISLYFLLYGVGMLLVGKVQNAEVKSSIKNSIKLEKASYLDPLTELSNRRYLFNLINNCRELAQQYSTVTIVAIDIDRFKTINDRFGHTAGDTCLVKFARVFEAELLSENTHCVRMGGEEFIALIFDANLTEVVQKSEALIEKTRETQFSVCGDMIKFTVSGGIAHGPLTSSQDMESLIDKADSFLYLAKENGRDRIEYSPTMSSAQAEPASHIKSSIRR